MNSDAELLAILRRRLEREQRARTEAESIAERSTRALYRKQQELRLLRDVAAAANSASSVEESLGTALALICGYTNWAVGHALTVDDKHIARSAGIWHFNDSIDISSFRQMTEKITFSRGVGLPGAVIDTGTSAWISNVCSYPSFVRAVEARRLGFRLGAAFPILVEAEVRAVLEFFSMTDQPRSEDILQLMNECGAQLGRTLDREERRKAESRARLLAESANHAKSLFLANMSHEVRTPLNGLLGMANLLLDGPLEPEQKEHVETILTSGRYLLTVLNDILDFSKIEAGKIEFEMIDFDIREMIRSVSHLSSMSAKEKRLKLLCNVESAVPISVHHDAGRIRQVLLNLMNNAIKFTEFGRVELVVRSERTLSANEVLLHFSVIDSGMGISLEAQRSIFDAFTQADISTTRKFGGTGLGLTLCARLIELMGGTISVKSEIGEGSCFSFSIVARSAETDTRSVLAVSDGAVSTAPSRHILVADDNSINQRVARGLLEKRGHSVVVASNGAEALQAMASQKFDLVLLDIQMPVMDGLTAISKIREEERTKGTPRRKVIALTASVMKQDIEQFIAAGLDGVLAKPLQVSELEKALELLNRPGGLAA